MKTITTKPTRKSVKVTFSDNSFIETEINGTQKEIREYYKIGRQFNLGNITDNMQKVTLLQFI